MNEETLKEWLLVYKTRTAGAHNKPATRGDIQELGELILRELLRMSA